ncbi:acyloxyacyl hydrolase [Gracilimonas sp.]|uniref:acyloxyacyl hydrolase n=1 Tax=Gracilimonas sp. TaxID=1974203 RepID=UPI0032F05DE3
MLLFFCVPTHKGFSQTPNVSNTSLSFWGGYSFSSVRFLGKTENSQTQILGIGIQKPLKKYYGNKLLWYTADLIPYIHFTYPKRDENNRIVSRKGFGLSPIGFTLMNSSQKLFTTFVRTTGGMIFMESNFPTDDARKLNFTFDITLGANFRFNSFGMISFGYKFHHISNAETGTENPGLDSNFLFLKLSIQ